MGALTSTVNLPPPIQSSFDRALLIRANPKTLHSRPARKKSLKQKSGNTMVFRRLEKFPLAMIPLTEGTPPTGMPMSKSDVQCTIQWYGNFTPITDVVEVTVQHPVLREANKLMGENAGETMDALDREVWVAGTSIFYGGNVAGRGDLTGIAHKIDAPALERIIRYLGSQNSNMFTEVVESSTKEGTIPIRDAWLSIITPEIYFTLDSLPGFVSVEHYQGQTKTMRGEVGAYKNIRFLMTTQGKKYLGGGGVKSGDVKSTSSNADVHVALFFAEDAVAEVPLEGHSLQNIIKPRGSAGTADPLDQIATSGWKHGGARVRLNEAFMTRLEVTVGDVSP